MNVQDGVTLTKEQRTAVARIDAFLADNSRQVFVLHGDAGTGKTTLLQHIAKTHKHSVLCAPTGKAASVLRRKSGLDACTIHAFFYKLIEKDPELRFARQHTTGDLRGELVLLDECSMVSEAIGRDLVDTGAKIIAVGDPGQLPPVKGRRFFDRADFTLIEIHRQALESPIIRQAHLVRSGEAYEADGPGFRVANKGTEADLYAADVVLCWTNPTRQLLNNRCRRIRGLIYQLPHQGEPIICLKNAPSYGVFNGEVYQLLQRFTENDDEIVVSVEGRAVTIPTVRFLGVESEIESDEEITTWFDYGYALTVHKSQGSEWDNVLLVDEFRGKDHRVEWLYTGITRAAERILILR